jgi:hypothetical protein
MAGISSEQPGSGFGRIGRTFDPYAGSRRDWGG